MKTFRKLRHNESLRSIFSNEIPKDDERIRREFDVRHGDLQKKRTEFEREIQQIRQDLSAKEEKRRLLADEYKRKDALKNEFADRLQEQLNGQKFDVFFDKISSDLKQKQDEKGNIVGMEKTYEKFLNQVRSTFDDDPACPLCYRKFENKIDSEQFIREMESLIKGPEYRRKIDRDLNLLQEKFDKTLNLRSVDEQHRQLEENELPTLKNRINQLDKEISDLKTRRTNIEEEFHEKHGVPLENCQIVQNEMIMLDKYVKERNELVEKIRVCQTKLNESGRKVERTLEQVQTEKNQLERSFETIDKQIQEKNVRLRSKIDFIQKIRENLTELKNEKIKLSSDLQRKQRLDEQLNKLTEQIQNVKVEIEKDKQLVEPIELELESKSKEKNSILLEKETILTRLNETVSSIRESRLFETPEEIVSRQTFQINQFEQKFNEAKNLDSSIEK